MHFMFRYIPCLSLFDNDKGRENVDCVQTDLIMVFFYGLWILWFVDYGYCGCYVYVVNIG